MKKSKKLFIPIIATLLALLVTIPIASSPTLTLPVNALLAGEPGPLTVGETWIYNFL